MQAVAATDAAEVEAQRVQPGFLRTGRQGIDDLVAERTTHQRMRMADQCIAGLSERRGDDRTWSSEAGFDQAGRTTHHFGTGFARGGRSEERRVGKECVSTGRYRGCP